MTASRVGRGWIEAGLVGFARANGLRKGVVNFEDRVLGAVGAFLDDVAVFVFDLGGGNVFAADDGEGVENVGGVGASCASRTKPKSGARGP